MSYKGHLTNPPYLKDLNMRQDFTFETLFTKDIVKSIASKSKEYSGDERISVVER